MATHVRSAGRLAEALARAEPNGAIWTQQFDNVANRQGHYENTGPDGLGSDQRQRRRLRLLRRNGWYGVRCDEPEQAPCRRMPASRRFLLYTEVTHGERDRPTLLSVRDAARRPGVSRTVLLVGKHNGPALAAQGAFLGRVTWRVPPHDAMTELEVEPLQ